MHPYNDRCQIDASVHWVGNHYESSLRRLYYAAIGRVSKPLFSFMGFVGSVGGEETHHPAYRSETPKGLRPPNCV